MDDGGPTLFQPRQIQGYPGSLDNEYDVTSKMFYGSEDAEGPSSEIIDAEPRTLPSVIKWDGGGHTVFVSFDNGTTKIPMVKSQNNFCTVVNLPEGNHNFKFLVDGQWKCDSNRERVTEGGEQFNSLVVKASDFEVFEALEVDSKGTDSSKSGLSRSPPGSYSQDIPAKNASANLAAPPSLPPQLLQVILNTGSPLQCEPTLLPEPNHVMLNHLYALSIKDGVIVMSGTHRYRKKYVTTLLYKPT